MQIQQQIQNQGFNASLKYWRKVRKMSQLDLALAADVSQRHVSWLETGRSTPSRDMVMKLSEAMEVPLRDRNKILNSAGFAAAYREKKLDEPDMQPVLQVLEDMLSNHEPYPAMVLDRFWNIKMQNRAADLLFNIQGDAQQTWDAVGDNGEKNLPLLTIHPNGLRQFISNFDETVGSFIRRLKAEAQTLGDPDVIDKLEELMPFLEDVDLDNQPELSITPVLPLALDFNGLKLNLVSVITTFGTAQDITANELKIEAFYPADEMSKKFFCE